MMLPWLHTLRKLYRDSSAASHAHVEFGLTISLKKTNIMGQYLCSIPSITMSDYVLVVVEVSPTLVPPSPATSPWMPNWTHRQARQWQQWLSLQRGSGKTSCWPSTPKWRCIRLACSAHYSVAVMHGLCIPARNTDAMHSICTTWEGFLASPGKTVS